jgi:hypothetical protein
MHKLTHLGKQPLKFTFELYICDVRGLPADVSQVSILWDRSGKTLSKSSTAVTQATGSAERYACVDEKLRTTATLYRNSRKATFDGKPSTITVLDMSGGPYSAPTPLGSADFDMADHAELDAQAAPRSKQLRVPRVVRRGDTADLDITIQLSISSQWHQGGGAGEAPSRESTMDDGTTSAGGTSASSALTHEALQALDAANGGGAAGSFAKVKLARSSSFTRGGKATKDSSRVAELSMLVAGAAADARQAESRLATLQFRLRSEVRAIVPIPPALTSSPCAPARQVRTPRPARKPFQLLTGAYHVAGARGLRGGARGSGGAQEAGRPGQGVP